MLTHREAMPGDPDFLVQADLKDWGTEADGWDVETLAGHREKIGAFVRRPDKAAWAFEDTDAGLLVGVILWRYRNRLDEDLEAWSVFGRLDAALFPPDGAFCEILQL